jgi:hypothetical protein
MTPPAPTFDFVLGIMHRLAHAQLATWLGGGWAEELWGFAHPRPHRDVDLWYPAATFARLDQWLADTPDLAAIPAKQFAHKRAFLCEGILIEVVLLEPDEKGGYRTNFFNRRYQLVWPPDPLGVLLVSGHQVPVGSWEALRLYRQQHHLVVEAYQTYLQQQF